MNEWPLDDEKDLIEFYGVPGQGLASLILPYPMRLSWNHDSVVRKITCHHKVMESLELILNNILEFYGSLDEIKKVRMDLFGGCFNIRKKRGGSELSIHSWGAAIDLDPENNQLKWKRDQATMPEAVINIFEKEGWVSLGRRKDYDYMHFQAANLKD